MYVVSRLENVSLIGQDKFVESIPSYLNALFLFKDSATTIGLHTKRNVVLFPLRNLLLSNLT